jgi:ribosomal protein S18 acetylase RimI-like enzyme
VTEPGVGHLSVIYLDPAHRGRGLGTLLLDRVIDQVRAEGATELWASVFVGNDKGIPFYRARGFTIVDKQKAFRSRDEDDVWSSRMRRSVAR